MSCLASSFNLCLNDSYKGENKTSENMSANKSLDIFAANIIHLFDPAKKNSCFFEKSYNFILLISTLYFNPLLTKPTYHLAYTISTRLLRIQQNKPRVNSELVHFRPSALK